MVVDVNLCNGRDLVRVTLYVVWLNARCLTGQKRRVADWAALSPPAIASRTLRCKLVLYRGQKTENPPTKP